MTRRERKVFINTLELGVLLTLLIVLLDIFGVLDPLERYLYDFRARDCQFFTPPPTDRIVHLDIDDPSLHEIGSFPWPRTDFAQMVEEIHLAGAKVLGMDIIFAESQLPDYQPRQDGKFEQIDHDQKFAAAIRQADNVLLPLSVNISKSQHSAIYHELVNRLVDNLEMDADELAPKLRGTKFDSKDLLKQVKEEFLPAAEEAMFRRVDLLVSAGINDIPTLRQRLTPIAEGRDLTTDATVLLGQTLPKVQSVRNVLRLARPLPSDVPGVVAAEDEKAITIPILSGTVRYTGYVDFIPSPDGVVRSVPLFVNYRGMLIPHMAMAMACALLDVDLNAIRFTENSVTLPVVGGNPITIPVRTVRSARYGTVGLFMDIPWSGNSQWENAFDPKHADSRQHVPLNRVWRICELRRDLDALNDKADDALLALAKVYSTSLAKATTYLAMPLERRNTAGRVEAINDTLDELKGLVDFSIYDKMKPADFTDDEKLFVPAYRALLQARQALTAISEKIQQLRLSLRGELNGRAALIGWTVTGNTDTYTTSIHSQCPGVAIQSAAMNAILTRHLWRSAPAWATASITLLIGLIVTVVVARLAPKQAMVCTLGLMSAYFIINGIVLFDWGNMIFGVAGPLASAALVWSSLTLVRYISEATQRRRITDRFRSYVDPVLVNHVIEHIEDAHLDGQVKLMTVVFTDLAGFTTISEKLRERTVPLLNDYMSLMLPVIRKNRGFWNKFLGDGIMFFFNAPDDNADHARDAVRTVLDMQKAMIGFNEKLHSKGLPFVAMRAGISTGPMVVGDAGSTDFDHPASDYTVLGDEVNLGAPLESANKALGSKILMNGKAASLCGPEFLLRPMGNIYVVGKTEGVMTYEALCRADEATDDQRKLADLSQQIVDLFRMADFEKCLEIIRQMEDSFGSSKFSQLYLHLAKSYVAEPPDKEFDGKIVLSEK